MDWSCQNQGEVFAPTQFFVSGKSPGNITPGGVYSYALQDASSPKYLDVAQYWVKSMRYIHILI